MEKNIILAGVGGQGILSIAYVIDNAALDAGYHFKQAEVHGMAQRGGAVQSNLRYADHEIYSDLIPSGRADMVLSVEPLEVMRYWQYLQPEGWIVTSVTPYINIPDYPELEVVLDELAEFERLMMVDSAQLARSAGNLRSQNMVVVGAASSLLDFSEEKLLKHVEALFARKGEKIVAVNRRAFTLGRAMGMFYRGLTEGGIAHVNAIQLCQKLDPETVDPRHASAWADAIGNDPSRLAEVLEGDGGVPCDRIAAPA